MRRVTADIEIGAPLQQVWDLVMDPRRLREWVTIHRTLDDVPELPLHDYSTFDQTVEVGGKAFQVKWRLLEAHEPRLAVWEGKGPGDSSADVTYDLSATGRGTTHFEYANVLHLPEGLKGWSARRLVSKDLPEREAHATLERLKELLEAEAQGQATQPSGGS